MSKDSKHQDPRTWVKLPDGKPLMKAVPKRNLGKLLKDRGIKVTELATALGVKRQTVHGWINGTQTMSNAHLVHAGLILDVSPLYLLDLTEREYTKNDAQLSLNEVLSSCNKRVQGYHDFRQTILDCLQQDWTTGKLGFFEWRYMDEGNRPDLEDPDEEESAHLLGEHVPADGGAPFDEEEYFDEGWEDWLLSIEGDYRDLTRLSRDAMRAYVLREPNVVQVMTLIETSRAVARCEETMNG